MNENGYISISQLNDFCFCPYSLYLHSIYEGRDASAFKALDQVRGTAVHQSVDSGSYSTKKTDRCTMSVCSNELGIVGVVDLYRESEALLLERKYKIHTIFPGHILQAHGLYFCLTEMGFDVQKIKIHSLSDNKIYPISLPTAEDLLRMQQQIAQMRNYDFDTTFPINEAKCAHCIYSPLCEKYTPD